jgi:hypothetical protein
MIGESPAVRVARTFSAVSDSRSSERASFSRVTVNDIVVPGSTVGSGTMTERFGSSFRSAAAVGTNVATRSRQTRAIVARRTAARPPVAARPLIVLAPSLPEYEAEPAYDNGVLAKYVRDFGSAANGAVTNPGVQWE